MNDIDGARSKNPFSVSPYRHQRRYDAKYIPESIAIQLDTAFKNDEIALYLQCVYWLLRLISAFPIICENAKRNAGLFESILKSIETDV